MIRHKPEFQYCGLTIILSQPSRFDLKNLLSGNAGEWFNNDCLRPEHNRWQCDVRLVEDKDPLLEGTKAILLLGEKAHRLYTNTTTTLDQGRGSPMIVNGIPCISSFSPQDCMDMKNHEAIHNKHYQTEEEYMSEEIEAGELIESKGRGKTARSNYRFWLEKDTKKIITILRNDGKIPADRLPLPEYIIRPSSREIVAALTNTKDDELYIDIETDFVTQDIRCIGFMFRSKPSKVYVFQLFDTHYKHCYGSEIYNIIRALFLAFRRNIVIAHNGAQFDFLVFALKLKLPVFRCYDTMVAQHRIYPDIEKSLGHCVSLATWQPFHKNEGTHSYMNEMQATELMRYCGKDVFTMLLVKLWQEEQMAKDPGLKQSIELAQRAIVPYLTTTITGIKFDNEKRQKWIKKNDRLMKCYLRFMRFLTGEKVPYLISNKTCCEYFHNMLNYDVVARSDKTNKPSLDEDALLELKLKYPQNLVIDFLIKYRMVQKQTGTLSFKVWRTENVLPKV